MSDGAPPDVSPALICPAPLRAGVHRFPGGPAAFIGRRSASALLLVVLIATAVMASEAVPLLFGTPHIRLRNGGVIEAGKAIAVRWGSKDLLIMPVHIFGPAGGYSRYIRPAEFGSQVSSLEVIDMGSDDVVARGGKSLLKSGTPVELNPRFLNEDLCAFTLLPGSHLRVFKLSTSPPDIGSRVWLKSMPVSSTSSTTETVPGKIEKAFRKGIQIRLERSVNFEGSSGAPIVDERQQLVAVLIGFRDSQRRTIMAIPSRFICERLKSELVR